MALETRLTKLIHTRLPIIMGGMAWIGNARLAAAVSEAGGLGVLGGATMTPGQLEEAISNLRAGGIDTFGVNLSLVDEGYKRLVPVLERKKVPVVTVSGGSPLKLTGRLKDAGSIVMHVVPSARLAEKAASAGVDVVIAEGFEAGGHVGADQIPTFVLVPMVAAAVDVPVVAAGGIASGHALAAALCLGADGVQVGTVLAAAVESPASEAYKDLVVKASELDPVVYSKSMEPARALKTPAVEQILTLEETGAASEEIMRVRGLGRAEAGLLEGDLEQGLFPAGLAAAQVHEIRAVSEIFKELMDGYRRAREELPNA